MKLLWNPEERYLYSFYKDNKKLMKAHPGSEIIFEVVRKTPRGKSISQDQFVAALTKNGYFTNQKLDYKKRALRFLLTTMRVEMKFPLLSNSSGYFVPNDLNSYLKGTKTLRKRAITQFNVLKNINLGVVEYLNFSSEQTKLEL